MLCGGRWLDVECPKNTHHCDSQRALGDSGARTWRKSARGRYCKRERHTNAATRSKCEVVTLSGVGKIGTLLDLALVSLHCFLHAVPSTYSGVIALVSLWPKSLWIFVSFRISTNRPSIQLDAHPLGYHVSFERDISGCDVWMPKGYGWVPPPDFFHQAADVGNLLEIGPLRESIPYYGVFRALIHANLK